LSPESASVSTRSRRVLVAEDNPVNRRLATLVLKKLGYAFDTAEDGEQAVRLHAATCYDAILMDCHMPNVDGLEATRRIRHQESPHVHTPVIALTANAEQEARERCLAAGMDDYLAKPVGLVELEAVLRRWVVRDA
jgi:two-component system sensor histidine kinase/response regulator